MRSGSFSHDPNRHTVVVCGGVACSVVRGVRIRTSMDSKRFYSKLVLVTDLGEKKSARDLQKAVLRGLIVCDKLVFCAPLDRCTLR